MLDPLVWWREHQYEYPKLASLARRFLCTTPTSVPCERAFSKAGWIVNKRRCSLSDGNVSAILFASFNKQHHEPTHRAVILKTLRSTNNVCWQIFSSNMIFYLHKLYEAFYFLPQIRFKLIS